MFFRGDPRWPFPVGEIDISSRLDEQSSDLGVSLGRGKQQRTDTEDAGIDVGARLDQHPRRSRIRFRLAYEHMSQTNPYESNRLSAYSIEGLTSDFVTVEGFAFGFIDETRWALVNVDADGLVVEEIALDGSKRTVAPGLPYLLSINFIVDGARGSWRLEGSEGESSELVVVDGSIGSSETEILRFTTTKSRPRATASSPQTAESFRPPTMFPTSRDESICSVFSRGFCRHRDHRRSLAPAATRRHSICLPCITLYVSFTGKGTRDVFDGASSSAARKCCPIEL